MSKIVVVDVATSSQLVGLEMPVEVCDESGRMLGHFVPASDDVRQVYEWAMTQISDEELDRRRQEPDGRTTAEVLRHLRGS